MNLKHWTVFLATAVIAFCGILGTSQLAFAEDNSNDKPEKKQRERGEDGERKHKGKHPIGKLMRSLDLTEEQREQIKPIMEAHREKMQAYREEHKDEVQALREEMKAARQDQNEEAAKAAGEQLRAIWEGRPKPEETLAQVRTHLTPEQQEKFDEGVEKIKQYHEERKAKMQEKREKKKEKRAEKQGEE